MGKINHTWQFSRVGGVNRVNLETGNDLLALELLDQKLWTALSSPVHGLEIDPKTLELIDSDGDGKIRVPEVIDAVKWITALVKNPDELIERNPALLLSSINDTNPLGNQLLTSARQILANIGKPDSTSITVEETSDTISIFANTKFNGDGIITEDSTEDSELKKCISTIVQCIGSVTDRCGKPGVSAEHIEMFFKACEDYSNWIGKAENNKSVILPFGERTEEAFVLFSVLKSKIDDYFLRCQMAEFDANSVDMLNSLSARVERINEKDLSTCIEEISSFPIAKVEADKPLSLDGGINPAWADRLQKLRVLVADSLGHQKSELSENEWLALCDKFRAFDSWRVEKSGSAVEDIGIDLVRQLLAGNYKESMLLLIEKDKALESEVNNIILVDKLVRYYRDIHALLCNFVTFSDFYSPDRKAIFQSGSLYFDQRSCDLCIKVSDMPKHNTMASSSGICLVYCDCFSKTKNERITIVAAITDGDVDNLVVGRNAVYYDRKGQDWDATIIKIIDNPISIRQAFWSPYRKFSRFISKQIEKVASTKEQEVQGVANAGIEKTAAKVDSGVSNSVKVAPAPGTVEPTKPAPFDIAKFAGIFAAIGMAIGAIGAILADVVGGLLSLTWWKMPIALLGIILVISGPSMIIAWLKLRKRNLAPVLDANGWAINAKATVNIPFGNTLTHLAVLPKNSKQNYIDPFRKKRNYWLPMLFVVVIILIGLYMLWHLGYLSEWGLI